MPRIRQYEEKYAREDFCKAIDHARVDAGVRTVKELAQAVEIPYTSFWKMMQEPEKITLGQLRKIVKEIPIKPADVLAFVGMDLKSN